MDDILWKIQVERATELSSENCIKAAHTLLFEKGYRIIKLTDNSISFDNGSTALRWRSRYEAFFIVNKGNFVYIADGDQAIIKFTCFVSYAPELVILTIVALLAVSAGYLVFLAVIPFAIQFAIKIDIIKQRTKEMLLDITKEDDIK